MKILDEEIEFDFLDGDDLEKLENAVAKTQKFIDNLDTKNTSTSKLIKDTCIAINKCFDNSFGEGTSERIFKGKYNIKICLRAFKELIEEKNKQENSFSEEMEEINKYLPNRQTRRSK